MTERSHLRPADVYGAGQLVVAATLGVTDLVERMHSTICRVPGIFGPLAPQPTRGITGLIYRSVRGTTRLVGAGLDAILPPLLPLAAEQPSSPEREAMLAALNGVLGDQLAAQGNPLAIAMHMRYDGQALEPRAPALAAALPQPGSRILLMVHGLCLNDRHWQCDGHDHGALLAAEFGYTPLYLHYNTGQHISTNGQALAELLHALLHHWPVPVDELVIVAHSMGGLVSRSACHYGELAGHAWLRRLRKMLFLGTPHQGAPLERIGNVLHGLLNISPYSAAFTHLAGIRSAGITDLRYGSMRHEDWTDRDRFSHAPDQRHAVPLPTGVQCYNVAATTGQAAGDLHDTLLGDGLVPLRSALGQHSSPRLALNMPSAQQWIGSNMNHLDLLHRHDVYAQLRQWFM